MKALRRAAEGWRLSVERDGQSVQPGHPGLKHEGSRHGELVRGCWARRRRAAAACRSLAAGVRLAGRRPGASPRRAGHSRPHGEGRPARLGDLLGTAGHRQDHGRAPPCRGYRPSFRAAVGDPVRRRRFAQSVRRRACAGASLAKGRCSSSTRSTASTERSRTPSFPIWRTAPSSWSVPPQRTPPSSSIRRCCRGRACSPSSGSTTRH